MGRHEMRWEELRVEELRWSASVKCGVWGVKSAMWSVRKVFAWRCIAMGPRAGHVLAWTATLQQVHIKHARTGLAGAWRMQVLEVTEGSLEAKLPTIWTDYKQRWEESERREEQKREDQRRERVRRKKMQVREKVGKSRNTVFFQWFVAPERRKVGSLKRRVRSHLARWEMKNCTPLWGEAHFQVKMYKTPHVRNAFGSCDVEKVYAVVARSTFRSQNVQSTPAPDHFWQLRCRKSACRCGAKHISKSKCTKRFSFGALLRVATWKKCMPLWREAHLQVKKLKPPHVWTTFGSWAVEKVHAVVARSTFPSQNVSNTRGSDHFWRFRCRFAWQAQGIVHLVKSEQNMRVLWHFQKRWQAWGIWRWSAKMHFPWQAQYKRHVHQSC